MSITHKEYQARDNSTRVCVRIICIHNNALLVIKRSKDGHNFCVLPGGGIDPEESPHQAAIRECLEETGVKIENTTLVYTEEPRENFPKTYYYTADYVSGTPQLDPESEEYKRSVAENSYEPSWITQKEAMANLKPNGIFDWGIIQF